MNTDLLDHATELLNLLLSTAFPGVEALRVQREYAAFEADPESYDVYITVPAWLERAKTNGSRFPVELRWDSIGLGIALAAPNGYLESLFWDALPNYTALIVPPLREGRLVVMRPSSLGSFSSAYVDGGSYLTLADGTRLPEPPPVNWQDQIVKSRWS